MSDVVVFCDDCLNPCDTWEYEFGDPDCHARQDKERKSKWDKNMTMGEWLYGDSSRVLDTNVELVPSDD